MAPTGEHKIHVRDEPDLRVERTQLSKFQHDTLKDFELCDLQIERQSQVNEEGEAAANHRPMFQ